MLINIKKLEAYIRMLDIEFEGEETWEGVVFDNEEYDVNIYSRANLDPTYVQGDISNIRYVVYGTLPDPNIPGYRMADVMSPEITSFTGYREDCDY